MNRPHLFIKPAYLAALVVCALSVLTGGAQAAHPGQQTNTQELYAAAKRQHEAGAYGQALETLEGLLKRDPDYAAALLLKSRVLVGLFTKTPAPRPEEVGSADARRERKIRQAKLLKESADSLERYLQLVPEAQGAKELGKRLDDLRFYAEPAIKPESERTFFSAWEVTERARILRKPPPFYPDEARSLRLSGNVQVLLLLAADGTVKHIMVLQSPDRSLTDSATEAAARIRFEPAIKDGHPVSTAVVVEYNFQTY